MATTDTPEACQGFVLQTASEYTSTLTLAQALQPPAGTDIGAAFLLGFSLPVVCFVVARMVRSVFVWEK
ncbi:hypothetical protein [Cupriavidus basilensis]|uniref:hypothetical protein n=1 Tax=Cupriavidus basilensis TaxID=68895 RepID=UPI00157AE797|nr:hypothetical protein [Cupriavidus basilensis]NUA30181.1 hypothetical protein [Cupriavidus basilensis]